MAATPEDIRIPADLLPADGRFGSGPSKVRKEQVDALFQTAKDTYGSVDIAFNNAGISPPEDDSILDTDLDAGSITFYLDETSSLGAPNGGLRIRAKTSGGLLRTAFLAF